MESRQTLADRMLRAVFGISGSMSVIVLLLLLPFSKGGPAWYGSALRFAMLVTPLLWIAAEISKRRVSTKISAEKWEQALVPLRVGMFVEVVYLGILLLIWIVYRPFP